MMAKKRRKRVTKRARGYVIVGSNRKIKVDTVCVDRESCEFFSTDKAGDRIVPCTVEVKV